jgi:hypothetical protein
LEEASRFYKVPMFQLRAALDGRKKSTLGTRWQRIKYDKLELVDPAINNQELTEATSTATSTTAKKGGGGKTNKNVTSADHLTPARQALIDQAIMDMEEEYKQDLKLPSILLGKGFVDLASSKKETTTTTLAKESNSSGSSGNNGVVGVFGVGAEVSTPFGDGTIEVIGITVRIALIFLHLNSHNIIC